MKRGQIVYSNFFIKGAYQIEFDDLCNYSFPIGCTIIIDEAGKWFNSRSWDKLPKDVFSLFTQHRHLKLDLIIGVQNFKRIDVSLREVIELTYWAVNYPFLPYFIHRGYFDLEKVGNMKESDKTKLVWKSKKIKQMYDTHAMKSEYDEIPIIPTREWEWYEGLELELSTVDKIKKKYQEWKLKRQQMKENDKFFSERIEEWKGEE
jgi:hypothetical protein